MPSAKFSSQESLTRNRVPLETHFPITLQLRKEFGNCKNCTDTLDMFIGTCATIKLMHHRTTMMLDELVNVDDTSVNDSL